jgi:hypothetical protein
MDFFNQTLSTLMEDYLLEIYLYPPLKSHQRCFLEN